MVIFDNLIAASMPLTKHLSVAIIDSNPALGKSSFIKKEDPPDPRVSTVTPATISFFKGNKSDTVKVFSNSGLSMLKLLCVCLEI